MHRIVVNSHQTHNLHVNKLLERKEELFDLGWVDEQHVSWMLVTYSSAYRFTLLTLEIYEPIIFGESSPLITTSAFKSCNRFVECEKSC